MGLPVADHAREGPNAVVEDLLEPLLLQGQDAQDEIAAGRQVGVDRRHVVDDPLGDADEEGLREAQLPAEADGAADEAPQHVAPPIVARNDAVADEECGATAVLGHDANGRIRLIAGAVLHLRQLAHPGHDGLEEVGLVDVAGALEDDGGAVQAQARVDVGCREGHPGPVQMLVELHEDEVPELDETARIVIGSLAVHPPLWVKVIVELAAGATGALVARRPPVVVLLAETDDALFRHAYVAAPVVEGFVVVQVDGDPDALRRQLQHLGRELPGQAMASFLK